MSQNILSFFVSCILLLCCCINAAAEFQPTGLTLKLIHHREAPESSHNVGGRSESEVPFEERFQKLLCQSDTNSHSPENQEQNPNSHSIHKIIRPPTQYGDPFLFLVKLGLGTFVDHNASVNYGHSFKSYYLQLDPGSDLTWVQCEGCKSHNHKCFPDEDSPFPNSQSKSYNPIPCKHPLCDHQNHCHGDGFCAFIRNYGPGSYTRGVLASETFTFMTPIKDQPRSIKNITFGCSIDSSDMIYPRLIKQNNPVSGVLGLGWGASSFLGQTHAITRGRFSYCISISNNQTTYLRFGKDIKPPKHSQTTRIFHHDPSTAYYVKLLDISVGGSKLKLNRTDLAFRSSNGHGGGCVIDSGTISTFLVKPVFDALHASLMEHLSHNKNLKRVIIHTKHKDLCYEERRPEEYKGLPNVTFHLGNNAELHVEPETVFLLRHLEGGKRSVFCLAMMSHDSMNIIGAFQQANHKFVFDTKSKRLRFGPEDCEKNA